jgi:hypothetical protein
MKEISSRVGKISIRSEGGKISLAAESGYPSEELIAALQALFGRVNTDCVARANEAAAAGAGGEEIIDILLGESCLADAPAGVDNDGTNILAWSVANPGKAAAIGLGTTAAAILGSWLIKKLIRRGKIKRSVLEGLDKIRRLQEASRGVEKGQAYGGVPEIALSTEEVKNISDRDPALIAMDEDFNISLKISNPTNTAYDLYNIIFVAKYYKKGEDLRKPYYEETISFDLSPEDFSSKSLSLKPGESRREILSLKRVPFKYKTSPEMGYIMSLTPVTLFFRNYSQNTGYSGVRSKVKLNQGTMVYSADTLELTK